MALIRAPARAAAAARAPTASAEPSNASTRARPAKGEGKGADARVQLGGHGPRRQPLGEPGQHRVADRRFPDQARLEEGAGRRLHRRVAEADRTPAETAAMLFWALLASGQITMRKVDGWQSLGQPPSTSTIDLAA